MIVDEDAVGEKAAERGLELVMMGIDEAGHDDRPRCRFGPTATIFLPSTSTSACGKSPTVGSMDITEPPRMT
jgi:hypothetical protein